MLLSVVVPVLDEEANIEPLAARIADALDGIEHEVVFVDDGSTDGTVAEIERVGRPGSRLLVLSRNYGQTTAMAAGIDAAEGELIVMLDADLQNDPYDIPTMMQVLERGQWDVVAGVRAKRQDGLLLRRIPSRFANFLIRRLTGVDIRDYGCTLKLFRREVAKNLSLYGELHRYIPVLASLNGARMTQMEVKHHPRLAGRSKYGITRTLKVASDLMLMVFLKKYGQRPMHFFGGLGLFLFTAGMLVNGYLTVEKLLGADIGGRPLLVLGLLLTISGVQLVTTGFVADLVMRTYYESQRKKPYRLKACRGFEGNACNPPRSPASLDRISDPKPESATCSR